MWFKKYLQKRRQDKALNAMVKSANRILGDNTVKPKVQKFKLVVAVLMTTIVVVAGISTIICNFHNISQFVLPVKTTQATLNTPQETIIYNKKSQTIKVENTSSKSPLANQEKDSIAIYDKGQKVKNKKMKTKYKDNSSKELLPLNKSANNNLHNTRPINELFQDFERQLQVVVANKSDPESLYNKYFSKKSNYGINNFRNFKIFVYAVIDTPFQFNIDKIIDISSNEAIVKGNFRIHDKQERGCVFEQTVIHDNSRWLFCTWTIKI